MLDNERRQVKSRERVRERGEVFTAEREVKAMCDLVKNETERIDSTFLEPACGDGNFLVEILRRKLAVAERRYGKSADDFAFHSIRALMSLYGVDILKDNVEACRERLLDIWRDLARTRKAQDPHADADANLERVARFVLEKNILFGNTLSMKLVDDEGKDLDEPIVFTEWTNPAGRKVKRREFRLDSLQRNENDTLFAWAEKDNNAFIPVPIREYPMTDYRELGEGDGR